MSAEETSMTLNREPAEARRTAAPGGALHHLKATSRTVHWGFFDASLAPALKVRSGDLVQAEAVTHHAGDAPELMMDAGVSEIFREIPEADRNPGVHIMTGPILIEEARAGDMLEVRYLSMTPRCAYGSNLAANWGYLYKEFGEKERVTIYRLDAAAGHAEALYA
jgi:acetamidase/formamidase